MKRELINKRHQGTRKKIIGDLVNWRIQIKKSMEEEASHLENRMLYCLFACFLSLILVLHHTCTRNSFAPTPKAKKSRKKNLNESVVKAAQKRIDAPDLKSREDVEDTERKHDHVRQRHSCFVLSPAKRSFFLASAHRRGLGFGAPMGHPGGFLFANFIFNFFARRGFLAAHEINPNYVSF
jgi:hypothetical protein